MGAAASASSDLEQMVACTFLLGQALTRSFPSIYTVNDFHADKAALARQLEKERERDISKRMLAAVPMVFLGPDGQVTPVQFVSRDEEHGTAPAHLAVEDNFGDSDNGKDKVKEAEKEAEEEEEEEEEAVDMSGCLVVEYQKRQVPLRMESVGEPNEDGWTVLHACVHQPSMADAALQVIAAFVERGESVGAKTSRGPGTFATEWTALSMACAYGVPTKVVEALLAAGADVHAVNSVGWQPLHEAVHRGYLDIVRVLLNAGADSNRLLPATVIAPYHPQLPLAHACRQNHSAIAKLLLERGALKDAQNEGGWSALHEAVFFRHEDCVRALLGEGSDVTLKTSQGYRAVDFETTASIRASVQALMPAGAAPAAATAAETAAAAAAAAAAADASPELGEQKQQQHGPEGGEDSESGAVKPAYRLLGDLPDFSQNSFMTTATLDADEADDDGARRKRIDKRKQMRKARRAAASKTNLTKGGPGRTATGPQSADTGSRAPPDEGVPGEYACQLTGKLMGDPVSTVYGNHFERSAILAWIRSQGSLCPVSGVPLTESELVVDKDLRFEINEWTLKEALSDTKTNSASGDGAEDAQASAPKAEPDLYDF